MKKLITRVAALCAINVALGLFLIVDMKHYPEPWQTDSVLYTIGGDQSYDFVVLGTSRARIFTEFKSNYYFVHDKLGLKMLNLAVPFGGGILPEKLFLGEFYRKGNTTKNLVIFLDPFMLFSDGLNREHRFVYYEPFQPRFFFDMLVGGIPPQRAFIYARSKLSHAWLTRTPPIQETDPRGLNDLHLDPAKLAERMNSLYPEGMNKATFNRYSGVFWQILAMAKKQGSRVIVIQPPTLLGEEPGFQMLFKYLIGFQDDDFVWKILTHQMQDPKYFADHDHLNSLGFEHFCTTYLLPLLSEPAK